jgi:hypothetical protein
MVYRLHSRNLKLGVFSADSRSFIGIRTKFGFRYLDSEIHAEAGGTASPTEELQPVAVGIPIATTLGAVCMVCDGPVKWAGPPPPAPWVHINQSDCFDSRPITKSNQALFAFLVKIEQEA